jgi:cardiolipin synthase
MAAKRGVDVRSVTPGIADKKVVYRLTRSNYAPLLNAGVRIYEYTPGFIHAKSYVCDDEFAVVGTINMDYRSLYLHFECGTFMYRTDSIMDLKKKQGVPEVRQGPPAGCAKSKNVCNFRKATLILV